MSRVNESKISVQHESCEGKCGLKESVRNSKQKCNHGECQYEWKMTRVLVKMFL